MKNIFLIGMPDIHKVLLSDITVNIKNVQIEINYQQVLGMAKAKELNRLCIYMDAWNCDYHYNGERGQTVAEKIHVVDPSIPILIWDGREYISDEDVSPVFKIEGEPKPITNDNELYLSFDHYSDLVIVITRKFFNGKLSIKDIPHRECVDMERTKF